MQQNENLNNQEHKVPGGQKAPQGEWRQQEVPGMQKTLVIQNGGAQKLRKPINPVLRDNTPYFLGMAAIYSICFAIAFYRNFVGITFPLITAATLVVCGLFLKKSKILWKKSNWWYVGGCLLLGISTFLTTNLFVIFFNTVGILLLITVFMLRQAYYGNNWNFGQYLVNLLFLYLNMIPELASPFIHLANYLQKYKRAEKKNKNRNFIFIGILIGLPMVAVVITLLSSADQIFSRVVGEICYKLFSQVIFSPNVFLVVLLILLGFFGIYSFLSALTLNNMPEWEERGAKKNPVIAITFLSMITAVYVVFCAIQLIFLFTGGLLLPEGYTYAEYAHQGFFQLLFVCIFNLVLVLFCLAIFEENKILKTMLLLCSGCTYIMIASSIFRMVLYISTYHLSFLRLLVLWFLGMLSVLMAGVIITVLKPKFDLFRYCMMVVTIFYVTFSFCKPDAIVAEYNFAKMGQEISFHDLEYLTRLSMDAAPVWSRYQFPHKNCNRQNTYVKEYDYYVYEGNWFYGTDDARYSKVQCCKRCLLNYRLHMILEKTKDMDARTFHCSKYLAKKAAKKYFSSY